MIRFGAVLIGGALVLSGFWFAHLEYRAHQIARIPVDQVMITGNPRGWSPALSQRARRAQLVQCVQDHTSVWMAFAPPKITQHMAQDCLAMAAHSRQVAPSWSLAYLAAARQYLALGDVPQGRAALARARLGAPNEYYLALHRLTAGFDFAPMAGAEGLYPGAAKDMRVALGEGTRMDQVAALYERHAPFQPWMQQQIAQAPPALQRGFVNALRLHQLGRAND